MSVSVLDDGQLHQLLRDDVPSGDLTTDSLGIGGLAARLDQRRVLTREVQDHRHVVGAVVGHGSHGKVLKLMSEMAAASHCF